MEGITIIRPHGAYSDIVWVQEETSRRICGFSIDAIIASTATPSADVGALTDHVVSLTGLNNPPAAFNFEVIDVSDPTNPIIVGSLASGGDAWWCGAIKAGVNFDDLDTDMAFEKIAAVMREQRPLIQS